MSDSRHLDRTKDVLGSLLAFPTLSGGSNLAMIDYLRDRLTACGADVRIYPDDTGEKANLFATIGPDLPGGVMLAGHSDVVPVEGQPWTVEPFAMTERDDRLIGRGAVDMKGFIATAVAMAPIFASETLDRPLHIAVTYDEEISCFGAAALVKSLATDGIQPAVAIVGEPTGMGIVEGHKGCYEYTTEFVGLEGHSSKPDDGVNAIEYAIRFVAHLYELRANLQGDAPSDSRYTPPWTTVHVGRIKGGTARNVIARRCRVDWEIRPVSVRDADNVKQAMADFVATTLKPTMTSIHPDADIVTHTVCEVESFEPVAKSEARDLVSDLTGAASADVVPFGTEAGIYQAAGISSIVCGPGSIRQAHMADEFIDVRQIQECLGMLERLRIKLIG